MKNKKRNLIFTCITIVIFLSGGFISLDWSRFFLLPHPEDSYKYVKVTKLFVSFLCTFIVFMIGVDRFTKEDSLRLKIAFLFIFAGDISFYFGKDLLGISTFMFGQIALIYRSSIGIIPYFKKIDKDEIKFPMILAIVIISITVLIITFVFWKHIDDLSFKLLFPVYGLFLCISVWVAWMSKKIGYFNEKNALLIAIGMSFFYFCDLTVGYGLLEINDYSKMFVTSLTWMFYTPALLLLAISAYNQNRIKKK